MGGSAGGVFKLIANDGKADRMIMATKLLNQRIKDVMCARRAAGKADITPTLTDLERTHILFVNAHFKPYAAIGYEYNRVRANSGQHVLGGTVTFSIPQFGDFFHDMVANARFGAVTATNIVTPPAQASGTPGNPSQFPANGEDPCGNAVPAGQTWTYSLVDAFGGAVDNATTNLLRYCEFPGNRLFTRVKFDVNGNPLDEYIDVVAAMNQKFRIAPHKETGYNRTVGQEVPIDAHTGPQSAPGYDLEYNASNNWNHYAGRVECFDFVNGTLNGGNRFDERGFNADQPDLCYYQSESNIARELRKVVDGPQTPKFTQPVLDMWIKLLFWFNNDARLSIASVSIPHGQRFITVDLARNEEMLFEFPNLYLKRVVQDWVAAQTASGTRSVTYTPILINTGVPDINIQRLILHVNNIFVNPEVHDIYIKRIGFSLIRVYRFHRARLSTANEDRLLSQLKWPIEYMFVGFRPAWNVNSNNPQQWRDWHRMSKLNTAQLDKIDCAEVPALEVDTTAANVNEPVTLQAAAHAAFVTSRCGQVVPLEYAYHVPTVDTLTISTHGINIYDNYDAAFFNAYQPSHYGGIHIRTPEDPGALMINFSLYPGTYQPSGHINVSRAREFYIQYTSSYIGQGNGACTADLYAIAIAINFLLITDGSAVLRYST